MAHGFPSIGGDLRSTVRSGRGSPRSSIPTRTEAGTASCTTTTTSSPSSSTPDTTRACRSACTRSGIRAIEQVLATWERVYLALDSRERRHFRARRHRVEHFVLPSADQVERAAMLGLSVSVQPAFDRHWGQGAGLYEERLGPARDGGPPDPHDARAGIEVGVGSDSPVTPLDPMAAIASLEQHHEPTQRLTRLEA